MFDKKIKHLELIQNVISRMGVNSFFIKGWTISLTSILIVLIKESEKTNYFILPIVVVGFWVLDAMFLSIEKSYRKLYDSVCSKTEDNIDFNMSTSDKKGYFFIKAFFSITLILYYGILIFLIIIRSCI